MQASSGVVHAGIVHGEQRRAERVRVNHKLAIRAHAWDTQGILERPAVFRDLSMLGALISTRQPLVPGQWIEMVIPTEGAPGDAGLPKSIVGRAYVQRTEPRPDQTHQVALRFGPSLAHSLDMATYIAYLLGL